VAVDGGPRPPLAVVMRFAGAAWWRPPGSGPDLSVAVPADVSARLASGIRPL